MDCTRGPKWKFYDFLRKHEIDILFLKEVIHPNIGELHGYRTYTIVETSFRGTDFVTRNEMHLPNINEFPSGRGMAAEYRGITLINIYAFSATAKRMEREPTYE